VSLRAAQSRGCHFRIFFYTAGIDRGVYVERMRAWGGRSVPGSPDSGKICSAAGNSESRREADGAYSGLGKFLNGGKLMVEACVQPLDTAIKGRG
jgi:hypothetical protein